VRNFIQKPIQPTILDEEFPDYLKLLDDMVTDPSPVTLPELSSLTTTSTAVGQKRSRTLLAGGEGEFEDTRASGSGTHHQVNASGSADTILPPSHGPTGQEDAEVPPEMIRANAVTAFIGSPLLPEPAQLRVDHIATLMALAVEGPIQNAAFKLLALAYSQQEVGAIWTACAPHLAPPPYHPLACGTLLRDAILHTLCTPYSPAKRARETTGKLVDGIVKAVTTQTFVAHTTADLSYEEMEVIIHFSHFVQIWAYLLLSSHSRCRTRFITRLNPPRETAKDSGRRRGIHTFTNGPTNSRSPSVGLAQQLLALIATLARAIWLAIPALFPYFGTFSPLIS
jgi:hypothetical protein